MASEKWRCEECSWCGDASDALSIPNPFQSDLVVYFCPNCKLAETMFMACDEPGCNREVTCGTPVDGGYRSTCHDHAPMLKVKNA